MGFLHRRGSGAVKHLTVKQLWLQEIFQGPDVETHKVPRKDNPSDLLCSAQTIDALRRHLGRLNFENTDTAIRGGGVDSSPL